MWLTLLLCYIAACFQPLENTGLYIYFSSLYAALPAASRYMSAVSYP